MKPLRVWTVILLAGSYLLVGGIPAQAALTESQEQTLLKRLDDLEREVALLKRQKEVDQEVQIKKDTETPVVVASKDGFGLQSKDKSFQLKFKGQIQADGRFYLGDNTSGGSNTYLLRKVRPILEGTVFKYFDFRLMPDFGGGTTSLQDAYIDYKYWKQASLRVGKFKSPFGLERLQSDAFNLFIEPSLATQLAPNRDVGIDLHGEFSNGLVSYDLGVFNGSVDIGSNDTDNHDDKDLVGRIFSQPFVNTDIDALNGLGVGVAGSIGSAHGSTSSTQLPAYRTFGQQQFFSYRSDVFADGKRYRLAPQAYYYNGPFGALGEWTFSEQQLKRSSLQEEVLNQAGQIAISYVLTGENASYNGVNVHNPFDPQNKQWGAWEIAARYNWLDIDGDVFPNDAAPASSASYARAWGIGLNWYLNKNLKLVTDFEQTRFAGGNVNDKARGVENALLTRLQLVF